MVIDVFDNAFSEFDALWPDDGRLPQTNWVETGDPIRPKTCLVSYERGLNLGGFQAFKASISLVGGLRVPEATGVHQHQVKARLNDTAKRNIKAQFGRALAVAGQGHLPALLAADGDNEPETFLGVHPTKGLDPLHVRYVSVQLRYSMPLSIQYCSTRPVLGIGVRTDGLYDTVDDLHQLLSLLWDIVWHNILAELAIQNGQTPEPLAALPYRSLVGGDFHIHNLYCGLRRKISFQNFDQLTPHIDLWVGVQKETAVDLQDCLSRLRQCAGANVLNQVNELTQDGEFAFLGLVAPGQGADPLYINVAGVGIGYRHKLKNGTTINPVYSDWAEIKDVYDDRYDGSGGYHLALQRLWAGVWAGVRYDLAGAAGQTVAEPFLGVPPIEIEDLRPGLGVAA